MSDDDAPRPGFFRPGSLAPFFAITALFHAACVATRFDEVAKMLPAGVAGGLLVGTFPLLFVEGYFESRIDYGKQLESLPLWMRIDSRPVKLSFTFAFTYLAIVLLQTWDVEIGPVDPTPPPEWPVGQRAQWFGTMTLAMFFPNYLAATSLLVPGLRVLGKLVHKLPSFLAVGLLGSLGVGVGYGVTLLLHDAAATSTVTSVQDTWSSITERPEVAIGLAFAGVLLPMIFGALFGKKDD
ncbi:MAG: hypothetical protein H6722_26620 [Sandaracinus sp.]|nr:hypothetical protein [Sandaracinus sp.]MCB9625436.1 hypothetical protein [Sandaracinus sp.]